MIPEVDSERGVEGSQGALEGRGGRQGREAANRHTPSAASWGKALPLGPLGDIPPS